METKDKALASDGRSREPGIKALFEEILVRHVVLSELRDIYRAKLGALLDAQGNRDRSLRSSGNERIATDG